MPDFFNIPLPPFLQWISWALTTFVPLGAFSLWVWKKFLADRWAARNQNMARKRAKKLVYEYLMIEEFKKDTARIIAAAGLCPFSMLAAFAFFVLGSFLIQESLDENSHIREILYSSITIFRISFSFVVVFSFVVSIICSFQAFEIAGRRLVPIFQGNQYRKRFKNRLAALLGRSGMTTIETAKYLDECFDQKVENDETD